MGKRPEDEIQKKLVELELSIKDEDAKRQLPAGPSGGGTELSTAKPADVDAAESSMKRDLYHWGGWACIAFGIFTFFSNIHVSTVGQGFFWGTPNSGAMGFLVLPLLVGLGILFYNYKSRLGQIVTVSDSRQSRRHRIDCNQQSEIAASKYDVDKLHHHGTADLYRVCAFG
jgi:hypothetical protein